MLRRQSLLLSVHGILVAGRHMKPREHCAEALCAFAGGVRAYSRVSWLGAAERPTDRPSTNQRHTRPLRSTGRKQTRHKDTKNEQPTNHQHGRTRKTTTRTRNAEASEAQPAQRREEGGTEGGKAERRARTCLARGVDEEPFVPSFGLFFCFFVFRRVNEITQRSNSARTTSGPINPTQMNTF